MTSNAKKKWEESCRQIKWCTVKRFYITTILTKKDTSKHKKKQEETAKPLREIQRKTKPVIVKETAKGKQYPFLLLIKQIKLGIKAHRLAGWIQNGD